MALTLQSNYRSALAQGFAESWLVQISNTGGSGTAAYIRLGTEEVGAGTDAVYHPFILNNMSIRESIDLEKGTAKTGNISIVCHNGQLANHSDAKLSEEILNQGTRYYLNHTVTVQSKVGSISSGDYLTVFTGRLKDVKLNSNHQVTLTIASATPIDFIKIPQFQSDSGNYYPIVYGDYKKTVASTDASPALVDEDSDVKVFPVEVDTLNGGRYNCLIHRSFSNEFLHYPVKDAFRNSDSYPIFAPIEQLDGSNNKTNNLTSINTYESETADTNRNVIQSQLNLLREYKYRPKIDSTSEVIDSDNVHADPFELEGLNPQANATDTSTSSFFQINHRVTSAATNSDKDANDFFRIKFSPTKEDHKVTAYSVFISYDVASYNNGFGGSSSQDAYEVSVQCRGLFDGDDTVETETDDSKDANGSFSHTFDFLSDFSKSDGNAPASFEISLLFNSVNMHNAETSSMTVKIKDIQIIAKAEIVDEGSSDSESNPLEHQSAVTSIKKLYFGGDGFEKHFGSGVVTNVIDMHRDILSRFTGRGGSSETPEGYSDMASARSGWKVEYWNTKPIEVKKLLEKIQFEGGFVFRFRTSDDKPQYIHIPNSNPTVDHKIGLEDISSFDLSVSPIDKLVTKRIIKYQKSPITDKQIYEQTAEDTTNSIRSNYNIQSNENIVTNTLDILIDDGDLDKSTSAINTGSGNRNDSFANYYRTINGVPKFTANVEIINSQSSNSGDSSKYFYGMEVGDFCQFESTVINNMPVFNGLTTSTIFIVISIARSPGSLKVTLREI
tara:strand:+ start:1017 stop:3365 length:2349 start_codon:yes stop_codon:yes gene_type:complete